MSLKREFIGEAPNGAPVYGYHLTNNNGMEVCVLNFGATIKNIIVPDKNGEKVDVALGFDDLEEYFDNGCFIGATIGPNGNRINKGKFSIDGKEYNLVINDGVNNLHSDDKNGFHKRIWETEEGTDSVTFTIEAEDGDIGFPGNRKLSLTYTLGDDNSLMLHYHATSDAKTLMNPTNHCYFNLGGTGSGTVENHIVKLYSSTYTPVVPGAIPTGEIATVEGTPLDFRTEKTIGKEITSDYEQIQVVSGYDHNFCVDAADGTRRIFADVTCPETGITMHCSTTLPGFQFYSGNFLNTEKGKNGKAYGKYEGFCLETQFYPDSINEENFPDPVFGPEREYDSVTVYQFS
ncbi:MAG: galactose mutarotase [Butyrivibrio sp.]|nr:galactose mutarotase [Butyrivibrio sp.]